MQQGYASIEVLLNGRAAGDGERDFAQSVGSLVFSYVLGIVGVVVALIAWVCALTVARVPAGVQQLGVYCLRYQIQTLGYLLLVTDRYPTLANEFRPASSSAAVGRT